MRAGSKIPAKEAKNAAENKFLDQACVTPDSAADTQVLELWKAVPRTLEVALSAV
jgi:hypothetical protein